MNDTEISEMILGFFREKEIMKNITVNDDFFDLGVSSLTIVELQIVIEKELKHNVPTSKLMGASTIGEWILLYTDRGNRTHR